MWKLTHHTSLLNTLNWFYSSISKVNTGDVQKHWKYSSNSCRDLGDRQDKLWESYRDETPPCHVSHPRKTKWKPVFVGLKHLKKSSSTWRLERDQLSGVSSTSPLFLPWYLNCYHSSSCSHLPWALTYPVALDPQITKVLKATLIKIHILSDWVLSGSSWAQIHRGSATVCSLS